MNNAVPSQAYELIKHFEGCKLEAYRCPAGHLTCGWGQTGAWIKPGMCITQQQADDYLQEALITIADAIPTDIWVTLQQHQRAALISFLYNVGNGALDAPSFGRAIRHNLSEVPARLLDWDKVVVNGIKQPLLGLTRRRRAEAILWQKAIVITEQNILDNWGRVQEYLSSNAHAATPLTTPIASISLVNAAKYYKGEPHQLKAFEWLDSQITEAQRSQFGTMYRALQSANVKANLIEVAKPNPWFIFDMPLKDKPSANIIVGTLRLKGFPQADSIREWDCTSGQPRYQYSGATDIKGKGALPGHKYVRDKNNNSIKHYVVSTSPYDLKHIKGIGGNAFHILPDPICINGMWRSELMIHNDANRLYSPGSAGCIVALSNATWQEIEKAINDIRKAGFKEIPLEVNH